MSFRGVYVYDGTTKPFCLINKDFGFEMGKWTRKKNEQRIFYRKSIDSNHESHATVTERTFTYSLKM
jgi:hypothetical protein